MTTDTIIRSDSNHPPEQKLSAIPFLVNRLCFYPITDTYRQLEHDTICRILYANKYHLSIMNRIHSQIQTTSRKKKLPISRTYTVGTRCITKHSTKIRHIYICRERDPVCYETL